MKIKTIFLLCVTAFMMSCSADKPKESSPPAASGRTETRGLEAAGAVGYDGKGIRRSVDKMLDKNDARNTESNKAIDHAKGE